METKLCTSIEQSQKLIKLGLDVNTADLSYMSYDGHLTLCPYNQIIKDGFDKEEVIPAWSLSTLLELMPGHSNIYKGDKDDDYKYVCAPISRVRESYGDNPLDAAFEMICWLLEYGML